jgi:hypothetical protein
LATRQQILWTRAQKLSFVWQRCGTLRNITRQEAAELILKIFQMHGLPEEADG